MGIIEEREMMGNNVRNNGEWHDAANKFRKGNPGRRAGTTNKFRKEIKSYLEKSFPDFLEWMQSLKPQQKCEVYLSLLPFALARLQSISVTDSEGNDIESQPLANVDFSKLSESTLKEILKHTTIEE